MGGIRGGGPTSVAAQRLPRPRVSVVGGSGLGPAWRRGALPALLCLLAATCILPPAGGVWELAEVWDDELVNPSYTLDPTWVSGATDDRTGELIPPRYISYIESATPVDPQSVPEARIQQGENPCSAADFGVVEGCKREPLLWEQQGWFETLKWRTSAGFYPGKDYIDTGLNYNMEEPQTLDDRKDYSNSLRRCGPSQDRSPDREQGCTNDLPNGLPGPGPQQWAYRGISMGPPAELRGEFLPNGMKCDYTLDPARPEFAACLSHPTGLESHMQTHYATVPLRWGFEEGTFYPFWKLASSGMPNFAVRGHCFLDSFSGQFQLCSAYPWERRELHHGILIVQSVPFTLGPGKLTFEANGGDITVPDFPDGASHMEVDGEGALGVTLTRASDGFRVLQIPVRARRFWSHEQWTEAELAPFVGEKFILEIFDYRCCKWGWLALDAFVLPAMHVEITAVYPSGGQRAGGTVLEITGQGFGESADGVTVFIGDKECGSVTMRSNGRINCVAPPGEGVGLTVTVVVGDYDRNLELGPFGGHQAGHCGSERSTWPYSECQYATDASPEWGVPARGFTYRDPPVFLPPAVGVFTATEDSLYMYTVAATDPDDDPLVYSAPFLPTWASFDPTTQTVAGTPLRSDVQCRGDDWHPAEDRCLGGGNHTIILEVTDYFYTVRQEFVINVQFAPTPLLSIDRSFHWPTLPELRIIQAQAQLAKYHLLVPAALAGRRIQEPIDTPAGIAMLEQLPGRSVIESSLRSLARSLMRETRIHEGELDALEKAVVLTGQQDALWDLMSRARGELRRQQEAEERNRIAYLAVQGRKYEGWYHQLRDLLLADQRGVRLLALDTLHALIELPVPCSPDVGSRLYVSCSFPGYKPLHHLRVKMTDDSLRVDDVTLREADCRQGAYPATVCSSGVPYSDLLNQAQRDNDFVTLIRSLRMRLSGYAYRWEQFSLLPASYEPWWQPSSSLLRVTLGGNRIAVLDIDHSYPWPTEPSPSRTRIRLVHLAGDFPYYIDEALDTLSDELTEVMSGGLLAVLESLDERLVRLSHRCINDCSGNGRCDVSVSPPACHCFPGYTHDDCSNVLCPNDCSGRGACDQQLVCVEERDTGEEDCTGGTAKCSCFYPFFGDSCDLAPCPQRFIALDGVNITDGLDSARAALFQEFTGFGEVTLVQVAADPEAPASAATVDLDLALGGVAYLEFARSEDAALARDSLLADAMPSRGVAEMAIFFAEELREQNRKEARIISMFGATAAQCGGRGACDYRTGECYCASAFYGGACEYSYCANDCAGHGKCDALTGACQCEVHYVRDAVLGCVRESLSLASTACEDEALDEALDEQGMRTSPLFLSCYLGVPLGATVDSGYTPPTTEGDGGWYTSVSSGVLCADCSGFANPNITTIDIYPEVRLQLQTETDPFGVTEVGDYIEPTRGIGALPDTNLTVNLDTLRARGITFSHFQASPGIVREWEQCFTRHQLSGRWQVGAQECGQTSENGEKATYGCLCENSMCGARFGVYLDGELVWESVVSSADFVNLDVREASTLTLVTGSYRGNYWRYSGESYGGGPPPALAGTPTRGRWCDGSAWAEAMLL